MPRSPFEPSAWRASRRAGRTALLTLAAMACSVMPATLAAGLTGDLEISGENLEISSDGRATLENAVLTHRESDARATASRATKTDKPGGVSDLDLSGTVRIEVRGAVLDATSAVMVFRNQELISVQVRGSQAQFSHQPEGSSRRIEGRADAIDYDAASGKVQFSGNTFYAFTDGSASGSVDVATYDINEGSVAGDRGSGVLQLNRARERVPPPRTPDRESAQ
ncbi:MAG TPA: LptA/OstA family protein [Steroidobacteraceae bacterium]|nr:LptA/OstA family protein [Steroidobacteraceae bacterium]